MPRVSSRLPTNVPPTCRPKKRRHVHGGVMTGHGRGYPSRNVNLIQLSLQFLKLRRVPNRRGVASSSISLCRRSCSWLHHSTDGYFPQSRKYVCLYFIDVHILTFARYSSRDNNKMAAPGNPAKYVWHVSRGFVFADGKRVVYPRLPMAWYHNTPSRASSEDMPPVLPPTTNLQDAHRQTQIVNSDNGQVPVVEGQKPADDPTEAIGTAETTVAAQEPIEQDDDVPCHPPVTDLAFKIPEELFQAARSAPKGSLESFWSYNLYRGPGKDGTPDQKVKVHYCTSRHTTERVLQQYFMNEKVLGFDLEWEPTATNTQGPRQNISLVQIASERRVGLFHVALYPEQDDLVAPSLRKIMEDPEVTKTGVWISGDCTRLRTFLGIDSRGTFELSHLHKLVKYSESGNPELVNKRLVSLANQIQEHMHLPLFKGDHVRASHWSRPLHYSQIMCTFSSPLRPPQKPLTPPRLRL